MAVQGDKVTIIHGARFSRRKAFRLATIDRRGKDPASYDEHGESSTTGVEAGQRDGGVGPGGRKRGTGEEGKKSGKGKRDSFALGSGSRKGTGKERSRVGGVLDALRDSRDTPPHAQAS